MSHLFGREYCPTKNRPPYFREADGSSSKSKAEGTRGGGASLPPPRRGRLQTASALGLDLLEAAVSGSSPVRGADGGVGGQGGADGQGEADAAAGSRLVRRRSSLGFSLPFSTSPGGLGLDRGSESALMSPGPSPAYTSPYGYALSPSLLAGAPSPGGPHSGRGGMAGGAGTNGPATLPPLLQHPLSDPQNRDLLLPTWRLKERMKTVGVGMILALNIGTDPPDVNKPNPCAKLQCWIDPTTMSRAKARERIGEKLEQQYARWQQRAKLKYKRALDPTVEDVRGLCVTMRRQARNERLLLHYNGHGVPRPTTDGEIYVFDKNHENFIPLSVLDLRRWIAKPSIVVLDCSGAGVLMPYLTGAMDHLHQQQQQQMDGMPIIQPPPPSPREAMRGESESAYAARTVRDTIVLCPTSGGDLLPLSPEFPADLFTSCLTTPIPIALRWFVHQNPLSCSSLDPDEVDSIPGKVNDRKTPLGELNWIFTAITDTVAWNVLPSPLFQRLFRQDLIIASMFRNFLLADRILRSLNCTPLSHPVLPSTHDHPLWQAWDLAVETCLNQLTRDGILGGGATAAVPGSAGVEGDGGADGDSGGGGDDMVVRSRPAAVTPSVAATPSAVTAPFFAEQLTAFEIWLCHAEAMRMQGGGETPELSYSQMESPEQLPVVLQVLLSQAHRVRALILLRRFLDLGPSAVNLALSVGIFPYVLKLLQSSQNEYKHVLVGIWAKILEFDPSCQVDLVKDGALPHFIRHLSWGLADASSTSSVGNGNAATPFPVGTQPSSTGRPDDDAAEQRTMAAVILSAICTGYSLGQAECLKKNLHGSCAMLLASVEHTDDDVSGRANVPEARSSFSEERVPPLFRLWLCICLGNLTKDSVAAQTEAYQSAVHLRLYARLDDDSPDVRAGACYALGCLIGSSSSPSSQQTKIEEERGASSKNAAPTQPVTVPMGMPPAQAIPGLNPSLLPPPGIGIPLQPTPGANLPWQQPQPQQQAPQAPHQFQPQTSYVPNVPTAVGGGAGLIPGPVIGGAGGHQQMTPQPIPPFQLQQQHQLQQEQQRRPKPSVFEDQRRLDFDLASAQSLLSATQDASPTVRYEAILSLACFVKKYFPAFATVAEESTAKSSREQPFSVNEQSNADLSSEERNEMGIINEEAEPAVLGNESHESQSRIAKLAMPRGVDNDRAKAFSSVWSTLHSLQQKEPHPDVLSAANTVVSAVNEHVFIVKTRLEKDGEASGMLCEEGGLQFPGGMVSNSPHEQAHTALQGIPPTLPLRRNQTDNLILRHGGDIDRESSAKMTKSLSSQALHMPRHLEDEFKFEYKISESKFYEWKRAEFGARGNNANYDHSPMPLDPLSLEGAVQVYRERRNMATHQESELLADEYAILAPKPPQRKRPPYGALGDSSEIELLDVLNDASAKAAADFEAEVTAKKQALHLGQSAILLNSGKQMTSMLRFHPYEPALVVCDGSNGVSIWDVNTAKRINEFSNGNPKKSRMTTVSWINEMTSSLLLTGSDDGQVRIWDGLIENSGGLSYDVPSLSSTFIAASDLVAGQRGSGLVTEWQQFNGQLLAGGSSKLIQCWDLEAEKCRNTLENNIDSCVTTLTTAWDYTSFDLQESQPISEGYSGIGPDIIVAGYGNGALKVFDTRAKPEPVSGDAGGVNHSFSKSHDRSPLRASRRSRRGKPMQYAEHSSWIVDTSFTGFGGRYEIVSGCVAGDIKFWDLRVPTSLRTLDVQRSPMTALACHPGIPLLASGSHAQFIKILSLDGDTLQVIRYHEEIAGQRMGPVSCLAFHPHKPLLAAGSTDEIISLYAPKGNG